MVLRRLATAAALSLLALAPAMAQDAAPAPALTLSGAITPTHDPVMIKQGDTYYLFMTGRGVQWRSSKDLRNWTAGGSVFATTPAWAVEAVPGLRSSLWAPDISFF